GPAKTTRHCRERNPVNGSQHLAAQTRRPGISTARPETQPALAPVASVERARRSLLARQHPDGHWVGELQGDTILESEFILLKAFLGREGDADVAACARYLRA